jgi:hypothetical protein
MRVTRSIPLLLILAFAGCKTADRSGASSLILAAGEAPLTPGEAQHLYVVNKSYGHGGLLELPIDPTREIEQITCKYDGRYSVVERGADGQPILNDEGKPRYKDGMYAHGYVLGADGVEREVSEKKFIDSDETDNWHDLTAEKGGMLVIRFALSDRYKDDPEVAAAQRQIRMESVLVRYKMAPGATSQDFIYNASYDYSMSPDAVAVSNGGSHKIQVAKGKRIYRIEVRWGDEKPRVNGVYVPGMASGRLSINGVPQGGSRNVAAIETQLWEPVSYTDAAGADNEIELSFFGDDARIHFIKVYYEEP